MCSGAPCITSKAAGTHVYPCHGLHFTLDVPSSCVNGGCGVIMDVHGYTLSANQEELNTGLRAKGTAAGYIVIQPTAKGTPASWTAADDKYVYAFLNETIVMFDINLGKSHMTGFSQGSDMTWRFLAEYPIFASMGSISYGPQEVRTAFKKQLPYLYIHGLRDKIENFKTANNSVATKIIKGWKMGDATVVNQDANHLHLRYANAQGIMFERVQHNYVARYFGQGHCFPGSSDTINHPMIPGQLYHYACPEDSSKSAFVVGDLLLNFFKAHESA